jgi:hypothetical protein
MLTHFNSIIFSPMEEKWKKNGGFDVHGDDEGAS